MVCKPDTTNESLGFNDDSDGTNDTQDDYEYDDQGNMVRDYNKGIVKIIYNHLNLPVSIDFAEIGQTISYFYNANGVKLKKVVNTGAPLYQETTTDYLGGFQYENTVLQFFPHPEGYVKHTPDKHGNPTYDYVYNYTDHLGNIRLSYTLDPATNVLKILEENHYYPFGLKHTNYSSDRKSFLKETEEDPKRIGSEVDGEELYKYKYNGKEWQDELGLNVYALDWRQYDPSIARFVTIDPETDALEQLDKSPYAFAWNNPVLHNDPDGRNPIKGLMQKILKSMGDDGVKIAAKNSKGQLKPVSQVQAKKILANGGSVFKTSTGASNKAAKKLMKEANPKTAVVRHDGHKLKNAQGEETTKTGFDHFQKKSGDGSHVFYDNAKNTVAVGAVATGDTEGANSESNSQKAEAFAGKATEFGAGVSDVVENFGTKVFGDNDFGKAINALNPLNLGLSKVLQEASKSLNDENKDGSK